jgi:UDP-N-acetylglucosamine 2-epimerase (non-hydrolysing)
MKFVTIVGARPQFIKLAPVSRALRAAGYTEVIVHTGQHYDENMSGAFFTELGIPTPDYHLGVGSGSHGAQTGRMLAAIEEALIAERPDGVILFGDTNSTLAGALAAVKLQIPIGHVEAGLRSYDRTIPEEINRLVTDHVSTYLYCPTQHACDQLRAEGVTTGVELSGDVMYDILLQMRPQLEERTPRLLESLGVRADAYTLVTIHRPATTDHREILAPILAGLSALPGKVIFPVHPRTRKSIERHALTLGPNVRAIEPLGYIDMLALTASAHRVVTDSGGLQKEAFLLETPCITLRDRTEWPETVAVGWNTLVASDPDAMLVAWSVTPPADPDINPFGDGDAAGHIVASLACWPART